MGLREELRAIYDQRQQLTPSLVVDAARPPESPLHRLFEWDDAVAGHKYRLEQAEHLIRSLQVVYRTDDDGNEWRVREYSVAPRGQSAYQPTQRLLEDPLTRQLLLQECKREWQAFKRKYAHLEEFASIIEAATAIPA